MKEQHVRRALTTGLWVTVGTLLLSFGTAVFLLPFAMVAGGVSGIAILLDTLIPWEWLHADLLIAALTWGLFALGWVAFGGAFAIKTLLSAIVYPIGIALFGRLTDPAVLGGLFDLRGSANSELALLLAAIFGGAAVGAGCAVTFLGGGSTGGVDILALLLCRGIPRLKSSFSLFLIDAAVILSGVVLLQDLPRSLLGILSALVSALVLDKLFLGGSSALVAMIVTDRAEQITHAVIGELGRTVTCFEVTGGYSKQRKQMLSVTLSLREYRTLCGILRTCDPSAFVTVFRAYEINGEGWT